MTNSLLHRDSLLSQFASELKFLEKSALERRRPPAPLVNLKVTLFHDEVKLYEFLGATEALYQLAEGFYWNDEANWSEANRLTINPY